MRKSRTIAAAAIALAASTALAACGSGGSSSNSSGGSSNGSGKSTLTWWNNATTGQLLTVWNNAVKTFDASHPNVTVKNVPIQNEQFTTKIPLALEGSSPPDIYQQWGGGQEATQVKSGKLTDMSAFTASWINSEVGTAATGWQVAGKQYGVPYDLHVVGFWYRKDLFSMAGITTPPATIAALESDDAKLKAHGITPIAVGSKDRWPDAFWWEYFAVRECPTSVLKQAMTSVSLSASCFSKASTDLTAFMKTDPFQSGFLATPSQVGSGSSAGLVASGKAAMELQGDWDPGVMDGLVSDGSTVNKQLGWFPFPAITGGQGDPKAVLGGGDGFSCTTGAAEPACEQFLQFLDSPAEQKQILSAGTGLPANSAAASAIAVPAEQQAESAFKGADYVQTYFDTALPTQPGQNLDNAVANFFAGQGSSSQIISSVQGPA
jgi:raffinose/stachyose/melibiose transport system substrate-binding protein